jgi:hypothetical protein
MILSRQQLISLLKVSVSLALVWIILAHFDLASFRSHWHRLNPLVVVMCISLLFLEMALLAAIRLKLVLECMGVRYALGSTSQVTLCGFFFEQVAFGFVGGDAMRLWLLHRRGASLGIAFQALFVDRCLGFAALLLLVLLGLPGLMGLLPAVDARSAVAWAYGAILALGAGAFGTLLLVPAKYRQHPLVAGILRLIALGRSEKGRRRRLALVFLCAVLTHLANVLVIFLIGSDLELPVTLKQWFSIIPAVLLFSMIPISAGGWGLREGILILALQNLSIPPHEAIVPSLVFGFGIMLAALPGGFVWFANRRNAVGALLTEEDLIRRS